MYVCGSVVGNGAAWVDDVAWEVTVSNVVTSPPLTGMMTGWVPGMSKCCCRLVW